jgi:APA family basic amino acid/polyamine antiporter
MVAYTGIETISNMAEEARDPGRDVPRSIGYVALAVFAIYAFLPSVALSAMPVHHVPFQNGSTDSSYTTLLATKFAGDPVAGIVQNLGLGALTKPMAYYVGLLAGTILIIATNAGIIGVSRLTYSMGVHRQFPDVLRTVHPRYRTPWVAIVIYSVAAILLMVPNQLTFLGVLYGFGAMLSFTIAHASVIALRLRKPDPDMPFRAPLNLNVRGKDVPLFAIVGGMGTLLAFVVTAVLFVNVAIVGVLWMTAGVITYIVYRRIKKLPLTTTVIAPPKVSGPAIELEYQTVLLHVTDAPVADEMTVTALRLAAERGARVVALYTIEVPVSATLDDVPGELEQRAARQLGEAEALGQLYGVPVIGRVVRTRNPGRSIVVEAAVRGCEVIVLGSPGRSPRSSRLFGNVVDYVLRNATCKVMVGAMPEWRGPQRIRDLEPL